MSEATPPIRLALSRLAAFIGISPDHGPVLIVDAAIRSIESLREKNGRLREEVRDLTSEVLRLSPEIEPETGESRAMDYRSEDEGLGDYSDWLDGDVCNDEKGDDEWIRD